jgi:hypothetical protein
MKKTLSEMDNDRQKVTDTLPCHIKDQETALQDEDYSLVKLKHLKLSGAGITT